MLLVSVAATLNWVILCAFSMSSVIGPPLTRLHEAHFKVLSADASAKIGNAYFEVIRPTSTQIILRVNYRFSNGDYDIDEDWLKLHRGGELPQMLKYKHTFFHANGSLDRVNEANFVNGNASCTIYDDGHAKVKSTKLSFPPDTYAGPAVMLPIRYSLFRHSAAIANFHFFACASSPEIFVVAAAIRQPAHWTFYPGNLAEVDIRPDFGWLDFVIALFIPQIRLWFDPAHDFQFAGATASRYYRGLSFIIVRETGRDHD